MYELKEIFELTLLVYTEQERSFQENIVIKSFQSK